jgi:predicted ferric reductase
VTTDPINQTLKLIGRFFAPIAFVAGYLVILLNWTTGSGSSLNVSFGAGLTAIGSLAGLTGAYLVLTQFMLQSRLPILEAPFGRAGLVKIHRLNGYLVIYTLLTHAFLVTLGYAVANNVSYLDQYLTFLKSFPDVLQSSIALALFVFIVISSITIVRRRFPYESWYFVHLMTYLAIILAFGHQLKVGIDFTSPSQQFMRDYWYFLYIFTAACVLIFRFIRPVYRLVRHKFTVERIVEEAENITSIYVTGRGLNKLQYEAGQFMIWRFLDTERFWQAHPFTISKAPDGRSLRLTYKAVGDFTRRLSGVKPGTPVLIDGPYGDFTLAGETNSDLLFLAGGIGLTPLRAMIESTPAQSRSTLIYSARKASDIALKSELEELAKSRHLKLIYLMSDDPGSAYEHGMLDEATIRRLAPKCSSQAIYLCGPPPMILGVTNVLLTMGIPKKAIHSERFAF